MALSPSDGWVGWKPPQSPGPGTSAPQKCVGTVQDTVLAYCLEVDL